MNRCRILSFVAVFWGVFSSYEPLTKNRLVLVTGPFWGWREGTGVTFCLCCPCAEESVAFFLPSALEQMLYCTVAETMEQGPGQNWWYPMPHRKIGRAAYCRLT